MIIGGRWGEGSRRVVRMPLSWRVGGRMGSVLGSELLRIMFKEVMGGGSGCGVAVVWEGHQAIGPRGVEMSGIIKRCRVLVVRGGRGHG